jgi:uncharacterized protein
MCAQALHATYGCSVFTAFFFDLRAHRIPVSVTEWLTLMEALVRGFDDASLSKFYHLCRALVVKRESHYDAYDRVFAKHFQGIHSERMKTLLADELLRWLADPIPLRELTEEDLARIQRMDMDELERTLQQRLQEQRERHDGGNKWVGTGGTSPFGHSGAHPEGIRVGGAGGGRTAVRVASERRFENLRTDRTLDVRGFEVALRKLRKLARTEGPLELDVDESVTESGKQGDIELVFRPERKNRVKLLLLVDVGGSMDPHAQLCERLFSAAHRAKHFRAFKSYYFHNCVYDRLYTDMNRAEGRPTADVLQELDAHWLVLFVGDAWMSPHELTSDGRYFSFDRGHAVTGLEQMKRLATKAKTSAWLNPEPPRIWQAPSVTMIRRITPMFELTLQGLDDAIDHLRGARVVEPLTDDGRPLQTW